MKTHHYCIIMAGGAGTRFWPLSRENKPKQFLDILGVGKSFLQQTYSRFLKIIPNENILVVTSVAYKNLVKEQLPNLPDANILLEPARRNTAPCIAYATYKLMAKNPDATVIVAPSDHLILDEDKFVETINLCIDAAEKRNSLVTIGIRPTRPETGYGYIQINSRIEENVDIFRVKTFTEKPNLEIAKAFIESKEFFWNAGIFIWTVKAIEKALKENLPEVADIFAAGENIYFTENEEDFIEKSYAETPAISIDFGVMEKAQNVEVACADFGWSDIGTWNSLYIYKNKDENKNAIDADFSYTENVKNTLVKTVSDKFVILKDLDDYLIVDTENVLMICPRTSDENIKKLTLEALIEGKNKKFV